MTVRQSARDRLAQVWEPTESQRAVNPDVTEARAPAARTSTMSDLRPAERHTFEILLSHVRHSVVRVCFYNLKLLCQSLIDEYDAELRTNIASQIALLPNVRRELVTFFDLTLNRDVRIVDLAPDIHHRVFSELSAIEHLAAQLQDSPESTDARTMVAERFPVHIDKIMDALHQIDAQLKSTKISLLNVARASVDLNNPHAISAGLTNCYIGSFQR